MKEINLGYWKHRIGLFNSPLKYFTSRYLSIGNVGDLFNEDVVRYLYGENIKITNNNIRLHLIGGLQTNKVKLAVKLFDYIHSVDSEKLARKISDEQKKQNKKIKVFIQVNIGNEEQKSGVNKSSVTELYSFCKALDLNVIGLMCIPPLEKSSDIFFQEMSNLSEDLKLNELSMGMSSDYLDAIKNSATYVRIGSNIFGKRG